MIELSNGRLLNLSQVLYIGRYGEYKGEYIVCFSGSTLHISEEEYNKIKEISTISMNIPREVNKTII